MAVYYFDVEAGAPRKDTVGREIADPLALRSHALVEAATIAAQHAKQGIESEVEITVRDATGAVCLSVRLISQVAVP